MLARYKEVLTDLRLILYHRSLAPEKVALHYAVQKGIREFHSVSCHSSLLSVCASGQYSAKEHLLNLLTSHVFHSDGDCQWWSRLVSARKCCMALLKDHVPLTMKVIYHSRSLPYWEQDSGTADDKSPRWKITLIMRDTMMRDHPEGKKHTILRLLFQEPLSSHFYINDMMNFGTTPTLMPFLFYS